MSRPDPRRDRQSERFVAAPADGIVGKGPIGEPVSRQRAEGGADRVGLVVVGVRVGLGEVDPSEHQRAAGDRAQVEQDRLAGAKVGPRGEPIAEPRAGDRSRQRGRGHRWLVVGAEIPSGQRQSLDQDRGRAQHLGVAPGRPAPRAAQGGPADARGRATQHRGVLQTSVALALLGGKVEGERRLDPGQCAEVAADLDQVGAAGVEMRLARPEVSGGPEGQAADRTGLDAPLELGAWAGPNAMEHGAVADAAGEAADAELRHPRRHPLVQRGEVGERERGAGRQHADGDGSLAVGLGGFRDRPAVEAEAGQRRRREQQRAGAGARALDVRRGEPRAHGRAKRVGLRGRELDPLLEQVLTLAPDDLQPLGARLIAQDPRLLKAVEAAGPEAELVPLCGGQSLQSTCIVEGENRLGGARRRDGGEGEPEERRERAGAARAASDMGVRSSHLSPCVSRAYRSAILRASARRPSIRSTAK